MQIRKSLLKLKNKLLDIVFPEGITCIFCGRDVVEGKICPSCKKQNIFNNGNRCILCDAPIKDGNIVCDHCKTNKPKFNNCSCPFLYNEHTRSSILKLKSDSAKYLVKPFVKHIYSRLQQDNVEFDLIVPVPSHPKTVKKRGYNPARLLADELSRLSGKPVADVLIKTVVTKNQKLLDFQQRQTNLENSITNSNPKLVKDKNVLIIDDIITTGATINACAKLLHKARKIHACAIARRHL
ncbi:MAG: ComF family protein [Clostridia bacterium]|nr:ComF family protein [Clostridia bacterium]